VSEVCGGASRSIDLWVSEEGARTQGTRGRDSEVEGSRPADARHFPTMNESYSGDRMSAIVLSLSAMPWRDVGAKLSQTPVRGHSRPVRSAAREGVQTEKPTWKSVKLIPPEESAWRLGVARAPKSP
jgi:hypothetical protein